MCKTKYYLFFYELIFLGLYFLSGLVFKYTANIYNISLFLTIIPLIILSLSNTLLKNLKINSHIILFVLTIILILIEINFPLLFSYTSKRTLFIYLCSYILPLIFKNFLFYFLTINNYSFFNIISYSIIILILVLLPIIPSLNWFFIGAFSLIKILLTYIIYKYFILKQTNQIRKTNSYSLIIYAFTLIFATILVGFASGFFRVVPIAISSNSMIPTFRRGDVVLFRKKKDREVFKVNDIIVYEENKRYIVHRILEVDYEKEILYITKGDYNNAADSIKVKERDIKGIYVGHLKYLGYPTVWINEYFKMS